nr:helix-turn-helix domain-containing protein [Corynebacterium callunae]
MSERNTLIIANKEWLTPLEASDLLPSVSRRSVQLWAKTGKLPNSIQLPSGQWRISRSDIDKIINPGLAS